MDKIRILLADDHHLFIRGIESILSEDESFHIVGKAQNGKEAYELALKLKPDILLLDLSMPVMDGLEALKIIIKELPDIKILMLTMNNSEELLIEALKYGAKGYLLKDLLPNEFITFVHMVSRGESIISGQIAGKIIENITRLTSQKTTEKRMNKIDLLTKREKEILFQVGKGLTNREIASTLFISENTVKNHLRNIMEKLHMNNRVQAATYCLKEGWLEGV